MASIAAAKVAKPSSIAWQQVDMVQWSPIAQGDTCADAELPGYADRTVQVTGTWGGATLAELPTCSACRSTT